MVEGAGRRDERLTGTSDGIAMVGGAFAPSSFPRRYRRGNLSRHRRGQRQAWGS